VRRRQHDIDLGLVANARRPAAEPLFTPEYISVGRLHQSMYPGFILDDLFDELMRFIDAEFQYR